MTRPSLMRSRRLPLRQLLLSLLVATAIQPAGLRAQSTASGGAAPASAPTDRGVGADRRIGREALQADLAILRVAYESLHPGLRRYNTDADLDAHWATLTREFDRDRTLGDAFLALARFTAALRCGHSYPNFYNQRDSVATALFASSPLVPFGFRWLDGRMIVTASATGDARLPRGTEVLAIDGRPVGQILDSLLPFVRTDGHNRAKQVSLLEVRGSDRYETFDVYFARRFPTREPRFTLTIRAPGSRRSSTITVAAITQAEREAMRRAAAPPVPASGEQWEFRFTGPRTAVLRMDGWAMYNTK